MAIVIKPTSISSPFSSSSQTTHLKKSNLYTNSSFFTPQSRIFSPTQLKKSNLFTDPILYTPKSTIFPSTHLEKSNVFADPVLCTSQLSSFSTTQLKKSNLFEEIESKPTFSHSPFTEQHSIQQYQRQSWVYNNQSDQSCPNPQNPKTARENDIALQLPELKKLLEVLRGKRENGNESKNKFGTGGVYLVGAGPGDPELLTVKAVRVIESADLVLYDRLVSLEVLDLVGDEARLLYVGKTEGYHSRTQEEIHELLLSFAEVGAKVVRLKGGDPLVFGRGGEEMDFLQQQGIHVTVIPGITSASGIAAELGMPLTHRGVANSVRFVTGHSVKGGTDPLYVAENAADPDCTLVVYMGLSTLPSLVLKLMQHGLPPDTPAAAVERGTTPQQRTVFAELKDLDHKTKSAHLVSPTLIVIGKVVALSPFWPHSSKEAFLLAGAM